MLEWLKAHAAPASPAPKQTSAAESQPTLNEQIRRKTAAVYGGGPHRGDGSSLEPRDLEGRFWDRLRKVRQ